MPAPTPKKTQAPPPASTPEPEYVPVDENGKEQVQAELEPFESYTQEELAFAKKTLSEMTEQDLLQSQAYIKNLEEQIKLPEAGGIAFTTIVGQHGSEVHVTARASSVIEALDSLYAGLKYSNDNYNTTTKKGPATVGGKTPATAAQDEQSTAGEGGTRALERIVVTSDKVDFYLAGWQWPVPDHRIKTKGGATIIANMFDSKLGWTPEHFSNTCEYKDDDVKGLMVDFVRTPKGKGKEGYWTNITRIYEAE